MISILFCIILYYFICYIIWVAYSGTMELQAEWHVHVWGGTEEKSIQVFVLDS